MRKSDVIEHFGTIRKAASALNVTYQCVHKWGEYVPQGAAYKLQVMTGGKLRVDESAYSPIERDRPNKRRAG